MTFVVFGCSTSNRASCLKDLQSSRVSREQPHRLMVTPSGLVSHCVCSSRVFCCCVLIIWLILLLLVDPPSPCSSGLGEPKRFPCYFTRTPKLRLHSAITGTGGSHNGRRARRRLCIVHMAVGSHSQLQGGLLLLGLGDVVVGDRVFLRSGLSVVVRSLSLQLGGSLLLCPLLLRLRSQRLHGDQAELDVRGLHNKCSPSTQWSFRSDLPGGDYKLTSQNRRYMKREPAKTLRLKYATRAARRLG
jgi:hypothetical protein